MRKGAGGLTPVKTDKAEGFVKIQSTGNASSTLPCLDGRTINRAVHFCTAVYITYLITTSAIITAVQDSAATVTSDFSIYDSTTAAANPTKAETLCDVA